jgi:Holliday junction resolvase RusA-like endonuclease
MAQGMQRYGDAKIALHVDIHPADKRKSDLDNRLKSLCDALMAAGLFDDDSQIDEILIRRKPIIKYGLCVVNIKRIEHEIDGPSN